MDGEELKQIRKKSGLNQTDFAEKLGLSIRTIQNWEGGHNVIPKSKALLIQNVFTDKEIMHESSQSGDLDEIYLDVEGEKINVSSLVIALDENHENLKLKHVHYRNWFKNASYEEALLLINKIRPEK